MAPVMLALNEWCRRRRVAYYPTWHAIARGELPARKIGGRWYVASDAKAEVTARPGRARTT